MLVYDHVCANNYKHIILYHCCLDDSQLVYFFQLRKRYIRDNKTNLFFVPLCFLSISVNSNNVQSLLNAANQYQVEPVKKMCVDFLKEQVDATNCLGKSLYLVRATTHNALLQRIK